MMPLIAEAQSTVEELKMFLEVDSLVEIKNKLDKLYMILVMLEIKF